MNRDIVLRLLARQTELTETESDFFFSALQPVRLRTGDLIEEAGKNTPGLVLVETGCLMTFYTDRDGHDYVAQFATSGWWTGDLQSIFSGQPSAYTTRALAESSVWVLSKARMDDLFSRFSVFDRYFRILFQKSLVAHQKRIIEAFSLTAEERYERFRARHPHLEQFVPLKYVALYLGITPEFLSKLRRKKAGG